MVRDPRIRDPGIGIPTYELWDACLVWLIGVVVCLWAAPWLKLFTCVDYGWRCGIISSCQISCQCEIVKRCWLWILTNVSSAIASTETFTSVPCHVAVWCNSRFCSAQLLAFCAACSIIMQFVCLFVQEGFALPDDDGEAAENDEEY